MKRILLVSLAAAGLLAAAEPVDLDRLRASILNNREEIVGRVLELTDDENQRFWPIYKQYRSDAAKIWAQLEPRTKSHREAYQSRALTDDAANAWVDAWLKASDDADDLKEEYLPRFRKVLPGQKLSRLYQIEEKMDNITRLAWFDFLQIEKK